MLLILPATPICFGTNSIHFHVSLIRNSPPNFLKSSMSVFEFKNKLNSLVILTLVDSHVHSNYLETRFPITQSFTYHFFNGEYGTKNIKE